MKTSLFIRIIQIVLLFFLGYQLYLLYQKDIRQIEEEYKDSKVFLFLLFGGFIATFYAVVRTNARVYGI
jgi:hypothetical protein